MVLRPFYKIIYTQKSYKKIWLSNFYSYCFFIENYRFLFHEKMIFTIWTLVIIRFKITNL